MEKLKFLIKLMRPQQWYKNFVVFLGIIFSGNLLHVNLVGTVVVAFISLCLFSSANYVMNDIHDVEKDREHPEKRKRPLTSKKVSVKEAIGLTAVLLILATYLAFSINFYFLLGSIVFFAISLLYSLFLRELFLVDVLTISVNFVLRAVLGAVAINVVASSWLILCTFLLALMLALGKRKSEIVALGKNAFRHRSVLKFYNSEFINSLILITTIALFVSYSVYSIFHILSDWIFLTIPVVIFILFRYIYLAFNKLENFKNSVDVLRDKQIIMAVSIWVIQILIILYVLT